MTSRKIFAAALLATVAISVPVSAQVLGGASGGVVGGAPGGVVGGLNGNAGIGDGMTTIPPTADARTSINGTVNTPPASGTVNTPPVTTPTNSVARNADTRAGAALDNSINSTPSANADARARANIGGQGMSAGVNGAAGTQQ